MIEIIFPLTSKEEIRIAVKKLTDEQKKILAESVIARKMLEMVQSFCSHDGQRTGFNDRDGSWAQPCPTCGYTY